MPPAGELRVRDVTHSTMVLNWDAAPGPVRSYIITYQPEEGDAKEVSSSPVVLNFPSVTKFTIKAHVVAKCSSCEGVYHMDGKVPAVPTSLFLSLL